MHKELSPGETHNSEKAKDEMISPPSFETPVEPIDSAVKLHSAAPHPKPPARAPEFSQPETQPPYVVEVEVDCEQCGGSGFDPSGIDPWGPEPCPVCQGAKTQRVIRNYLAEALRITGNSECLLPVERAHLVAIVQYCRQVVDAAMCRPKSAALKRPRTRHRRKASLKPKIIQIENFLTERTKKKC